MEKFKLSPNDKTVDLEVVRMATYSIGYLNKQIILILWTNGVEPEVFINMQREYIQSIFNYFNYWFSNKSKRIFDELLWSVNFISKSLRKILEQFVQEKETESSEVNDKIKIQNNFLKSDPFVGSLIRLIWYNKFTELKKRFRVYDEKWWVLIGAIDPYNWLEEGEVYVSFCKHIPLAKSSGDRKSISVIEGKVLVTRNPWVHPGDVRVLKAVTHDKLKDYVNVIIFSAKGNRPEQDKMASGDLDGDMYCFCIFMSRSF